ncbi:hypothetical protein B1812_15115 [Methylocystis bryophila]|uniref:Uncharacterized protein n=1 Tax=Methylocystis bryophila TaxID=655015 RepID=A0A1W6MX77_9HYPH|nr:hypothetical protein B1812_15115 [Methylocystis bryophila]
MAAFLKLFQFLDATDALAVEPSHSNGDRALRLKRLEAISAVIEDGEQCPAPLAAVDLRAVVMQAQFQSLSRKSAKRFPVRA